MGEYRFNPPGPVDRNPVTRVNALLLEVIR